MQIALASNKLREAAKAVCRFQRQTPLYAESLSKAQKEDIRGVIWKDFAERQLIWVFVDRCQKRGSKY